MPAPTISQVMTALEERLAAIEGLRTKNFVPEQINPPMAVVAVPDIENYRASFRRGSWELPFTIYILVSKVLDRVSQLALADFASPTGDKSIPLAIEGDRSQGQQTLGGLVSDVVVDRYRNLNDEEVGVIEYFGGVFELRVIASGV